MDKWRNGEVEISQVERWIIGEMDKWKDGEVESWGDGDDQPFKTIIQLQLTV